MIGQNSFLRPSTGTTRKAGYKGEKKKRVVYSADFETITDPNDCRVWLWGMSAVDDTRQNVEYGTTLESFIERIQDHNSMVYFHNLKFDGHFILDWLLRNDFEHIEDDDRKLYHFSFSTIISAMGKVYQIKICWENGHVTELRDSLKKLPMSVADVAKTFDLEMSKGDIDYDLYRAPGQEPTPEELDYLERDVKIVSSALKEVMDAGMNRLTVASDSMAEYKRLIGEKTFRMWFPVLDENMDSEIRRAYRGGFTYADERFKSRKVGSGLVLDVNSLYPAVMYNEVLPYGSPKYQSGKVEATESRPLSIFSVTFTAKLKPNHIPCIQIKGSAIFGATEYIKEIKDPVTLMVSNVDWKLYNDHYDVEVLAYGGGWTFKGSRGMFDAYIDKWTKVKQESEGGRRAIAKLHLNSLYGKFASNPVITGKVPYLEDDRVKFRRGMDKRKDPVYTPVGVFVTAYARNLTIRAAQENYDVFAYADTDSLHLMTTDIPDNIDVHPNRMGAWKLEYRFTEAFYVRAKAYLELKENGKYHVAWAGLPERISEQLTFDDLIDGSVLTGKLQPRSVPGGIVLENVDYTISL